MNGRRLKKILAKRLNEAPTAVKAVSKTYRAVKSALAQAGLEASTPEPSPNASLAEKVQYISENALRIFGAQYYAVQQKKRKRG
jgi:hypothetical protein